MKISYSIKEAAAAIGVSTWTIWQLVKNGELWTFKLGARTLIQAEVLQAFITEKAAGSQPTPA